VLLSYYGLPGYYEDFQPGAVISTASLQTTLKRFVYLYNHHIPQKGLHHKTSLQILKYWYAQKPSLFKKNPRNHPGGDHGWMSLQGVVVMPAWEQIHMLINVGALVAAEKLSIAC